MGSVLFEELTRLVEAADEELHHNDRAGRPIPLQSKRLKAAHRHARNASALADHTARNFPVDQQRWLHSKAAEKHVHASHMARDDGFSHLAGMHHQAAQYHAAKAQQGHASSGLVHHAPSAGHGRAGHTLPAQPEVGPGQAAQTPTGSVSPTRARAAGQHWNDQTGDYQDVPGEVQRVRRRAGVVSRAANRISKDQRFTEKERAAHHQAAAHLNVRAAQELMRHGFSRQGKKHVDQAQRHFDKHVAHSKSGYRHG